MSQDASTSSAPVRILLVDDQVANVIALEAGLEVLGAALVRAHSGTQALRDVLENDFALILMDVQMPGMDGFETASLIKQRARSKHVPIIFVTALDEEARYVAQGYDVGAVDYITKPIDMGVLRAKVKVFIDLHRTANALKEKGEALAKRSMELARIAGERRYRDLAESMPQIVWTADAGGRLTYCNQHWFVTSGAATANHSTCTWDQILHPDDLAPFVAEWERGVARELDWSADYRFGNRENGTYRWHMVRVVAVRGEEGMPTSFVGTSTDIDDRRHAEEALWFLAQASTALADSREIEGTLATLATIAVPRLGDACVVDLRGEDGGWRRIAVAHVDPTHLDSLRAKLPAPNDAITGSAELYEVGEMGTAVRAPCGVHGELLAAITVLTRQGRRMSPSGVALLEDVARRVATAIDSARAYRAAEQERNKLAEANRAKDEFLAVLSHELRTPLNSVLGWTKLLRAGDLPEHAMSQALETIERSARSQAQLVADLLDVSRIVSGKLRVARESVDLCEVVESAVQAFRPVADQKSIALEAHVDPYIGKVVGDRARLDQILANLLSNAIKFTTEGRVLVTLERVGGRAHLVVSDTGQGIRPDFLRHVFDRFRQADSSTTRQHGGLGLGLAIVHHLIEAHGGGVTAESEGVGKGSTFTVDLPLVEAAANAGHEAQSPRPSASSRKTLAGLQVLVVEDDPDGRGLVIAMIERMGAKVQGVGTAGEALLAMAAERPDLLVSDIGLPGQDGYALISEVRGREGPERTPAIALTAYVSTEDAAQALAAGFDAHVAKPIDEAELAHALTTLAPSASMA